MITLTNIEQPAEEKPINTLKPKRQIYAPLVYDRFNPAHAYLGNLSSDESKATMTRVLHRIAKIIAAEIPGADLDKVTLENVDWASLDAHHIVTLKSALKKQTSFSAESSKKNYSPSYSNLMLSAIKGVARQAFLKEQMSESQYRRIQEQKRAKGKRVSNDSKPLETSEIEKVLLACNSLPSPEKQRDLCIIGLMYAAGLRRFEVASIEYPTNVDMAGGLLRIIGKGDKERVVPLNSLLRRWIEDYLIVRGTMPGPFIYRLQRTKEIGTNKLILKGISGVAAYNVCLKVATLAGIPKFKPHDYRRTFGTELMESNVQLNKIADLLGHSSVTTTQLYTRNRDSIEESRKIVELLSAVKTN
jgi:site-specific recombinase XerD